MEFIFYLSVFILFYSYLGYGLIIFVLVRVKNWLSPGSSTLIAETPGVSLIIAAYNEAEILTEKISNCLSLTYPADRFEVIFVLDGSTDQSAEIMLDYPQIRTLYEPARSGKTAALNRAAAVAANEILIFSDANTMLNREAIREISRCYADPRVGGVAGEKKVMKAGFNEADEGEGLYWRYESILKKLDSALYTVVGAAGELFSIRRQLFTSLDERIILDDFVLSMRITMKGYMVKYAATAYAMELPSADVREELKRKIRISAGAFQAMGMLVPLLNMFRYPVVSFQYISHRVLRWTLCPLALLTAFASNFFLLPSVYFGLMLGLQGCFYGAALTGWALTQAGKKAGPFYVPYYFTIMNFALIAGFIRFSQQKQGAVWEKARRVTSITG